MAIKPIPVVEMEQDENIPAYDIPAAFPTYDSLQKGAPGKKAK